MQGGGGVKVAVLESLWSHSYMYTARTHVKYSIKVGVGGRDSGSLLLP